MDAEDSTASAGRSRAVSMDADLGSPTPGGEGEFSSVVFRNNSFDSTFSWVYFINFYWIFYISSFFRFDYFDLTF
jgi:hypothetical protein